MDRVMQLQPKSCEIKTENAAHKTSTGFIAQEVLPLFPDLVSAFKHPTKDSTDNNTYYGLNYAGFGVVAIKAIQEQQSIIDAQNKGIDKLEKQVELLLTK